MSNIYYPESYNNHPEIKRLEQRIADLEKENKELKEQKDFMFDQYQSASKTAETYLNECIRNHKDWLNAEEKIKKYIDQIRTFNGLSFIRKATFQFRID